MLIISKIKYSNVLLFATIALSMLFVWGFFQDFSLYHRYDRHLIQSLSLLNGYTYLPFDSKDFHHDLHFYNGVYYSAWGYGVPILQLPFHFISILLTDLTFPTIFIFIFYSCITARIMHNFFLREYNEIVSFLLTLIIIYFSIYWLISYRFYIYEENAAYFGLFIINSFIYFINLIESNNKKFIPYLVGNLFIAIMIRDTGLIIAALLFLYLLIKKRKLLVPYLYFFILPAIFYMLLSFDKTGGIFPAGAATIHAGMTEELLHNRLGSPCLDGATIDIYIERFLQFFRAFFITQEVSGLELTSPNCIIILEDMTGINKPWIAPVIGLTIIISFYALFKEKKFIDLTFIVIGILTILILYSFLANGAAYRYVVDFYFYIFFSLYLLSRSMFFRENISLRSTKFVIGIVLATFMYKSASIIHENYASASLLDNPIDHNNLSWESDLQGWSIIRKCGDPSLDADQVGFDMMGWSKDCRMNKFINTYLNLPSDKKYFKLKLTGKNIPETFTVRINGILYENFNHQDDSIYIRKIITNSFNLFLYNDTHENDIYIEQIRLK